MPRKIYIPLLLAAFTALFYFTLPKPNITPRQPLSPLVFDKSGQLLRAYTASDERWRLPISHKDIDKSYLKMLIQFEDKRYYSHIGFDPLAITRAFLQTVSHQKTTSGASTLTMQTARLLSGENTKGFRGKLNQIYQAIALERHYSKAEILDLYLTLAPFGGNLEGVRAASLTLFGKEPKRLSYAEAALLVALPQAPEARRHNLTALKAARDRVLKAANLTREDYELALLEPMPKTRHAMPMLAAQTADVLMQSRGSNYHTTIDAKLQARLEAHVKEYIAPLDKQISVAIVVVENATGAVRASVGGVDYFNKERAGAMDLTRAIRSPGSALKPFIYGFAFDNGIAHPETLLDDKPTRYGFWAPENFDHGFTGQVTARVALQQSLNLPAVELLSLLGTQRFLSRLKAGEINTVLPKNSDTGLAVGLGGLGLSLKDLVTGYVAIARGGQGVQLKFLQNQHVKPLNPMFSPQSSWYLQDILKGAPPPPNALPLKLAFKTGTSYGYRDAWAVGFDMKHTIGVWVGRADNQSVTGLVGRLVAAPLLFDAFAMNGLDNTPFMKPADIISAKTQDLPPPLRQKRSEGFEKTAPLKLIFPPDGARLERAERLNLKVAGGVAPYIYMVNNMPIDAATMRKELEYSPISSGFMQFSVVDKEGQTASSQVRIDP